MRELRLSIVWSRRVLTEVCLASLIGLLIGVITTAYGLVFNYLSTAVETYLKNFTLVIALSTLLLLTSYVLVRSSSFRSGSVLEDFLLTYHFRGGYVSIKDLALILIASLATVSAGGSVGVAGIAVFTGYALAKYLVDRLGIIYDRKYYSIVGAVAGISAVFKAPLTGMAFSLEMPFKRGIEVSYLLPSLASALTAYVVSKLFFGGRELLEFIKPKTYALTYSLILHSIMIGFLAVLTVFMAYTLKYSLRFIKVKFLAKYPYTIPLVASSTIILAFTTVPEVLGSGYSLIPKLLEIEEYGALISISLIKLILTLLILEFGGAGGIFVPLLISGAALGAAYGRLLNLPYVDLLMMAGIAGVFSAGNKVLLTSVLLAAESGGLIAVIPAGISAAIAYSLSVYTSIHFLQPPIGHGRIRARLSKLLTLMCNEGYDYLSKSDLKQYLRSPCIVRAEEGIIDALTKCLKHKYIVVTGSRSLSYVRTSVLATYSKLNLNVGDVAEKMPSIRVKDGLSRAIEEIVYGNNDLVVITDDNGIPRGILGIEDVEEILRRVLISKCVVVIDEGKLT